MAYTRIVFPKRMAKIPGYAPQKQRYYAELLRANNMEPYKWLKIILNFYIE